MTIYYRCPEYETIPLQKYKTYKKITHYISIKYKSEKRSYQIPEHLPWYVNFADDIFKKNCFL